MKTPMRTSSVYNQLQQLNVTWREINGMQTAIAIENDTQKTSQLGIADLSCLTRFGVKGPNAAAWLESQNVPIPETPNTWCPFSEDGLVARLGITEFLIEDGLNTSIALRLTESCQNPPAKVYPVLRQDLAIGLSGLAVNDLLLQTCNINFQALDLNTRPVLLTSMIGVTVTIIPGERSGQPFYRIWCDNTFGNYFWETLLEIAQELGGNAIGIDLLFNSKLITQNS